MSGPASPATGGYKLEAATPWRYEIHAMVVLMCSPCDFYEAYEKAKTGDDIRRAINQLNFSDDFKKAVGKHADVFLTLKPQLKVITDTFATLTNGVWTRPPHPSASDAFRIIEAMKNLGTT